MDSPVTKLSDKNKQIAIKVGIVAMVILFFFFINKKSDQKPTDSNQNQESVVTTTSTKTETTATTTTNTAPVVKPTTKPKSAKPLISYQKALSSYQYKFQFTNCTANPAKLNLKQGVKIMLDNRDEVARTIGIGTTRYTLKAYDFVIVTAPSAGNYALTCNGRTVGEVKTQT